MVGLILGGWAAESPVAMLRHPKRLLGSNPRLLSLSGRAIGRGTLQGRRRFGHHRVRLDRSAAGRFQSQLGLDINP
jgi:hypothetical protein